MSKELKELSGKGKRGEGKKKKKNARMGQNLSEPLT